MIDIMIVIIISMISSSSCCCCSSGSGSGSGSGMIIILINIIGMIIIIVIIFIIIITSKLVKSHQSSSVITQGVSRETFRFFNRRLVTSFYGCPSVAEQEHVRKSLMSRVKHPMLRLSQKVTT